MNMIKFASCLALVVAMPALASDKARITGQHSQSAQCISPVAINTIDGKLVNVSPQGFDLDPGKHKLMGRASINTGNCPSVRGRRSNPVQPLEADFEAGKLYYVGLDHSSKNTEDWKIVIWKVEDRN